MQSDSIGLEIAMEVRQNLWKIAGSGRSIPRSLLERARELRKHQTSSEEILWECLRDRRFLNAKFRRQHNISQFIADFYCHAARLVIELDGEIHGSQQVEDANRDLWMEERGLVVLRFGNDQVLDDLAGVLGMIAEVIEPSPLAPLPQGEGDKSSALPLAKETKHTSSNNANLLPPSP
jgi:very-short-patch-repair endonuclease